MIIEKQIDKVFKEIKKELRKEFARLEEISNLKNTAHYDGKSVGLNSIQRYLNIPKISAPKVEAIRYDEPFSRGLEIEDEIFEIERVEVYYKKVQ